MPNDKTTPVLPGNRPDFVAQGYTLKEIPNRIIAPVYPENFVRAVLCVSVLQILNPNIQFWPVTIEEMADIKKEAEGHEDWFVMDLDNSVEKLIAKTWPHFESGYIVDYEYSDGKPNYAAASKITMEIGRALDKECTVANSVFVNMIYSGYEELVYDGIIYNSGKSNSSMLKMKHVNDDPEFVRQKISEKVLEIAEQVTPLVERYMASINGSFYAQALVDRAIEDATYNRESNVVFLDRYFLVDGAALRQLIYEEKVDWVAQATPDHFKGGYFIFPVPKLGKVSPINSVPKDKFIKWVESNHSIVHADPNTRDGIRVTTREAALKVIEELEAGLPDVK